MKTYPAPPSDVSKYTSITQDDESIAYRTKLRTDFINYYVDQDDEVVPIDLSKHILYSYHTPDALTPDSAYSKAAGIDLKSPKNYTVRPRDNVIINTGIGLRTTRKNVYFQLQTRSSYAIKMLVVNGGVIDRDYYGSIHVILANLGWRPHEIKRGDKIAQVIPTNYCNLPLMEDPIRPRAKRPNPLEKKRTVSFKEVESDLENQLSRGLRVDENASVSSLEPFSPQFFERYEKQLRNTPKTVKQLNDEFFDQYEEDFARKNNEHDKEKRSNRKSPKKIRGSKKFGSSGH